MKSTYAFERRKKHPDLDMKIKMFDLKNDYPEKCSVIWFHLLLRFVILDDGCISSSKLSLQ